MTTYERVGHVESGKIIQNEIQVKHSSQQW